MTGSIHHKEKHLSAYEIKNMIGKERSLINFLNLLLLEILVPV